MVLSLSAVNLLSHELRAPKIQPSQELLSPIMKETALCGTGRQTATGIPLTFCQENGVASSAWHGLQASQEAARTRVGGSRCEVPGSLLSSFM